MKHLDMLDAAITEEASWMRQMRAEYEEALDNANAAYERLQRSGRNLEQLVGARQRLRGRSDAV